MVSDNEPRQGRSESSSVLGAIVAGLRDHPPLLYGLGGALVIASLASAAGGIATDRMWLLVAAVVVVVLAGLGAWLVLHTGSSARLRVGGSATMRDRAQALTRPAGSDTFAPKATIKGDLDMSGDSRLASESTENRPPEHP